MAIHLLRDYVSQNTTTSNRRYISTYLTSIFLRRTLGYTYVGDTNFNINSVGQYLFATGDTTPTVAPTFPVGNKAGIANNGAAIEINIPIAVRGVIPSDVGRVLVFKSSLYPFRNSGAFVISSLQQGNATTIAAGSNNVALPTGTINVVSTTGFPASGTFFVGPNTTTTAPLSTTVAAGSNNAVLAQATTIAVASNGQSLPQTTINVASTTGFPTSGTMFVVTSGGTQTVTYTGTTATTFTGCTGGSGTMSTGGAVTAASVLVASTTGFPASGSILVVSSTGTQVVAYTAITGTRFDGCTGGTGTLSTGNTVQSVSTINVTSTTGFTTTGSIHLLTTTGVQTIAYTGTTATTFTGCTGLTSLLFTGATVFSVNDIQTITYTGTTSTTFTGCTGGTGTLATGEPVYNQNKFVIDYRGNGDLALVEANDTVPWYLYDKDINCPTTGNVNTSSAGQYRGSGNSTTPRVILQSPHALAWQVRICNETLTDTETNFNSNYMTFAPGFGGNSAGDFITNGRHLHGAMYYDSSSEIYNTGIGCGDNAGTGPIYRYTMMGDDTGQTVHIFARRPLNATSPPAFYINFGFPDNEPLPLPLDNVARLYCLGNAYGNNVGNGRLSDISLQVGHGTNSVIQGATMSLYNFGPKACSPALLAYVTGNNQFAGPAFDGSASDSPFTSTTELIPVDLVSGVTQTWDNVTSTQSFPYESRVIGTIPLIRSGRTNFGDFVLATDTGSWSVSAATNASPIQITTSATNTLVTGQIVAISGVGGNTAANGTFTVTVLNNTQFTLNGSTGNGAYTSGGTVLRGASFQHMRRGIYMQWNGPAVVP